ncbi:MAG: hypothetical protein R3D98_01700 [Candidatus Krumholzibacteriia bacterium]
MSHRRPLALLVLILSLALLGACGKAEKALDTAGLSVGKDLTNLMGEATRMFSGITDLESAKAALPKLTDLDTTLGELVAKAADLSAESKQSLSGLVKGAMPALEAAVAKVSAMEGGISDTLKPAIDSMMGKLKTLT